MDSWHGTLWTDREEATVEGEAQAADWFWSICVHIAAPRGQMEIAGAGNGDMWTRRKRQVSQPNRIAELPVLSALGYQASLEIGKQG